MCLLQGSVHNCILYTLRRISCCSCPPLISSKSWYRQIPQQSYLQHAARIRAPAPAGLQHPLDDVSTTRITGDHNTRCLSPTDCGLCCLSGSASARSKWKKMEISLTFVLLSSRLSSCLKPGSNTRKHTHSRVTRSVSTVIWWCSRTSLPSSKTRQRPGAFERLFLPWRKEETCL